MIEDTKNNVKEKMAKAIEHFENEIAGIRSGRVSTSLVDDIKVDVYGNTMTLKSVATTTVSDAATILITPWDKSTSGPIEKAINDSGIGATVSNQGAFLRVSLPPLSDERRKEYQKLVSAKAEDTKVAMRNIRRDALDDVKKAEKKGEVTEDDRYQLQEALDKIIDEHESKVDELKLKKHNELEG